MKTKSTATHDIHASQYHASIQEKVKSNGIIGVSYF